MLNNNDRRKYKIFLFSFLFLRLHHTHMLQGVRVRVSIDKLIVREIRKEPQRVLPAYYHFTYPRYHIDTNNPNITTNDMLYSARKTE
jgi:hypothetical protein